MSLDYLIIKQFRQLRVFIKTVCQRYSLTPKKIFRSLGFGAVLLAFLFMGKKEDKAVNVEISKNATATETVLASEIISKQPRLLKLPDEALKDISATSFIFINASSSAVLATRNENLRLPPASLTKLMTGLIAKEKFNLEEEVIIKRQCLGLEGNNMRLVPDEKITVKNLLYGLLISSASDAACSLATHLSVPAGKISMLEFTNLMNKTASRLQLNNTHFVNPIGLDAEIADHYSSAKDILKLSLAVINDQFLAEIAKTPRITVSSVDKVTFHNLVSTNKLLEEFPGTKGIKTGYTDNAGQCLSVLYEDGERQIIGVIMGSKNRFGEARRIIEEILESLNY